MTVADYKLLYVSEERSCQWVRRKHATPVARLPGKDLGFDILGFIVVIGQSMSISITGHDQSVVRARILPRGDEIDLSRECSWAAIVPHTSTPGASLFYLRDYEKSNNKKAANSESPAPEVDEEHVYALLTLKLVSGG